MKKPCRCYECKSPIVGEGYSFKFWNFCSSYCKSKFSKRHFKEKERILVVIVILLVGKILWEIAWAAVAAFSN